MDKIRITYLGQCGFLLDFGDCRIVTDPYLSDYVDRHYFSDVTPWERLYPAPASLEELRPDLILISHAHHDHMDPWTLEPYIKQSGKAFISAPAPVCALLRSLGAPHIHAAVAEKRFSAGDVRITPIASAHTELHPDEKGCFYELSYLIEKNNLRLFFGGDMSLYPGLSDRLKKAACQVLFLPVNGRDDKRTADGIIGNITCAEAASLASSLNAELYIPMHHDLYAINGCSTTEIETSADSAGARLLVMKAGETIEFQGGTV